MTHRHRGGKLALAAVVSLVTVLAGAVPAYASPAYGAPTSPQPSNLPGGGGWTWDQCLGTESSNESAIMYEHSTNGTEYVLRCGVGGDSGYGLRHIRDGHSGNSLGSGNFTESHVTGCLSEALDHGTNTGPSSNNPDNDVYKAVEHDTNEGMTLTVWIIVRRIDDSIVTAYPNIAVEYGGTLYNDWAGCATWWTTRPGARELAANGSLVAS